jgi:hypothetical protein
MQPLPDWTDIWPQQPGAYLFYGYPTNKQADVSPRLTLVMVEKGPHYRTLRTSMKKSTGAAGFFMPLMAPEVFPDPEKLEKEADKALRRAKNLRVKRLRKSLSEEFR